MGQQPGAGGGNDQLRRHLAQEAVGGLVLLLRLYQIKCGHRHIPDGDHQLVFGVEGQAVQIVEPVRARTRKRCE